MGTIKCIVWNIEGIFSKCPITGFKNLILQQDIIGLIEAWTDNLPELNGYSKHEKKAKKQGLKGRKAGGIGLYIREGLQEKKIIKNKMEGVIWTKLNKKETNIILGIVYRNPENSKYENREFFEKIEEEIMDIKKKHPKAKMVIAGDWNARTGTAEDYTELEETQGDEYWRETMCNRKNQDHVINAPGRKLLKMCKKTGLRIINGRVENDESGKITFINKNGASAIDIVLADEKILLEKTINIKIEDEVYAHHMPVVIEIKMGEEYRTYKRNEQEENIRKYKWNEKKKKVFETRKTNLVHKFMEIGVEQALKKNNTDRAVQLLTTMVQFDGKEMEVKKEREIRKGMAGVNATVQKIINLYRERFPKKILE